jgi:hypothetical protein
MNVDGFIVHQNVNRAMQGEELDVTYLADISADAIPALADAYRTQPLPASVKEGLGAALTCYTVEHTNEPVPWQSFHYDYWSAGKILNTLKTDLKGYTAESGDRGYRVSTPSGQEYYCNSYLD